MRMIDLRRKVESFQRAWAHPVYHQVFAVQQMVDNRIYWARFMTEGRIRGIMVTFARR